jgi:hypothetical protein
MRGSKGRNPGDAAAGNSERDGPAAVPQKKMHRKGSVGDKRVYTLTQWKAKRILGQLARAFAFVAKDRAAAKEIT